MGIAARFCPFTPSCVQRFLILWGKLGNRCKVMPVYALLRAVILDFKARLANRCMLVPVYALQRASILDFRPRLANRCNTIVVAVENGPPAMAVVATTFRVRFYFSLSQRRIVSPAVAVAAATFCIRFYFSLPQRRIARLQRPSPQRPSVSDSNFRCRKGE